MKIHTPLRRDDPSATQHSTHRLGKNQWGQGADGLFLIWFLSYIMVVLIQSSPLAPSLPKCKKKKMDYTVSLFWKQKYGGQTSYILLVCAAVSAPYRVVLGSTVGNTTGMCFVQTLCLLRLHKMYCKPGFKVPAKPLYITMQPDGWIYQQLHEIPSRHKTKLQQAFICAS